MNSFLPDSACWHRVGAIRCICAGLSMAIASCRGQPASIFGGQPTVHTIAAGQAIRLAFVPNAPAAFWDMASHGLKKFEKETGVHVELKYPPTGSVEEQNRILEDLASQSYSGVALSVIAPQDQVRDLNRA